MITSHVYHERKHFLITTFMKSILLATGSYKKYLSFAYNVRKDLHLVITYQSHNGDKAIFEVLFGFFKTIEVPAISQYLYFRTLLSWN